MEETTETIAAPETETEETAIPESTGTETEEGESELSRFVAEDARKFAERFPDTDLAALDRSKTFRRFCGSRYGRESIAELYEDYLAVTEGTVQAERARTESRRARSTGGGGGGAYAALSTGQRAALDEWNRAYPGMKMTAAEYLRRTK